MAVWGSLHVHSTIMSSIVPSPSLINLEEQKIINPVPAMSTRTRTVRPPDRQRHRLFYEPIVLEYALIHACETTRAGSPESPMVESHALMAHEKLFRSFVYKLAQVCDSERGGDTVTAFAVIKGTGGPEYVFASNKRNAEALLETKKHIGDIIGFAGSNPPNMKPKALKKKILWKVLQFNLPRVKAYVTNVATYLDECIKDCKRRHDEVEGKQYTLTRCQGRNY